MQEVEQSVKDPRDHLGCEEGARSERVRGRTPPCNTKRHIVNKSSTCSRLKTDIVAQKAPRLAKHEMQ
jgi:hypothetical protein